MGESEQVGRVADSLEDSSVDRPDHAGRPVTRRRISPSNLLVAVVTLAGTLWGAWWLYDRLANVYVLDARIASDMLLMSSRVPGWVDAIPVTEAAAVRKGDTLVLIDSREATAHLGELGAGVEVLDASIEALEARIVQVGHRTASRIDATTAMLEAALSQQAATQGDLEIATAEWQRAGPLRERNLISQQDFEADRNAFRTAQQAARRHDAHVANARAELGLAYAEREEINVLRADLSRLRRERDRALLQVEQAQTVLDHHRIRSPIDGVVDELFVDPGENVSPGQRVLLMHDPQQIWVKANVKETDLRYIKPDAEVSLTVDAYPEDARAGRVSRIGAAATSQSALLPNPNPSGNFTKTTQRVEIRIDLLEFDPDLKPGMMVEVKIPRSG